MLQVFELPEDHGMYSKDSIGNIEVLQLELPALPAHKVTNANIFIWHTRTDAHDQSSIYVSDNPENSICQLFIAYESDDKQLNPCLTLLLHQSTLMDLICRNRCMQQIDPYNPHVVPKLPWDAWKNGIIHQFKGSQWSDRPMAGQKCLFRKLEEFKIFDFKESNVLHRTSKCMSLYEFQNL